MTYPKTAFRASVFFSVLLTAASGSDAPTEPLGHQDLIQLTQDLSTDAMAGRAAGTAGNLAARRYLLDTIEALGLRPFVTTAGGAIELVDAGDDYTHVFSRSRTLTSGEVEALPDGVNLLFAIRGTGSGEQAIVITAHYDHLGVIDGEIYNGADDNASGVAGVFAIAKHFQAAPPKNTVIFALLDAEENGLAGARAFVQDFGSRLDIGLNINLDMISRSDVNELYAAGTYHQPHWVPFFEQLADQVPVTLLLGYDDPAMGPRNDWTQLSDHFAFHEQGIPFIYFGVEDHPDYHQPGDVFERIPLAFFLRSLETVVIAAEAIDASLDQLLVHDQNTDSATSAN